MDAKQSQVDDPKYLYTESTLNELIREMCVHICMYVYKTNNCRGHKVKRGYWKIRRVEKKILSGINTLY